MYFYTSQSQHPWPSNHMQCIQVVGGFGWSTELKGGLASKHIGKGRKGLACRASGASVSGVPSVEQSRQITCILIGIYASKEEKKTWGWSLQCVFFLQLGGFSFPLVMLKFGEVSLHVGELAGSSQHGEVSASIPHTGSLVPAYKQTCVGKTCPTCKPYLRVGDFPTKKRKNHACVWGVFM